MSARIIEQWWENGRLHRVWFDPANGHTTHERLIPPKHIQAHARELEALRDERKERARRADGLILKARFTTNERDELFRQGIKGGDVDGINWALKQDRWRHAKVTD